jgi:hypothetical protein
MYKRKKDMDAARVFRMETGGTARWEAGDGLIVDEAKGTALVIPAAVLALFYEPERVAEPEPVAPENWGGGGKPQKEAWKGGSPRTTKKTPVMPKGITRKRGAPGTPGEKKVRMLHWKVGDMKPLQRRQASILITLVELARSNGKNSLVSQTTLASSLTARDTKSGSWTARMSEMIVRGYVETTIIDKVRYYAPTDAGLAVFDANEAEMRLVSREQC